MNIIPFPTNLVDGGHLRAMSGSQFKMLLALLGLANANGDASISILDLEKITGFRQNTVIRSIRALETMGYVSVTHAPQDEHHTPNTYHIDLNKCFFEQAPSQE